MAETPASNGSRSTFLEDALLSEEPVQKSSSSEMESDDAVEPEHDSPASLPTPRRASSMPTPPIFRSSRYTILRGGRSRAQRGDSAIDAGLPSVQAVIEAYEAGRRSQNAAPVDDVDSSIKDDFANSRRAPERRASSTETRAQRTESGDSYVPFTVEEASSTSSESSFAASRASPIVVEQLNGHAQTSAENAMPARKSFKRTRFEDEESTSWNSDAEGPAGPARRQPRRREYVVDEGDGAALYDYPRHVRRTSVQRQWSQSNRSHDVPQPLRYRTEGSGPMPITNRQSSLDQRRYAAYTDGAESPARWNVSSASYSDYNRGQFERSISRGRSRLGDRFGDSLEHDSGPTINIYNRVDMDERQDFPYPKYVSHSISPSYVRQDPRISSSRKKYEDEVEQEIAELELYRRHRSRSRGRSDTIASPSTSVIRSAVRPDTGMALTRASSEPEHQLIIRHPNVLDDQPELLPDTERGAIETKLALEVLEEDAIKDDEAAAKDVREERMTGSGYAFVLPPQYSSAVNSDFSAHDGASEPSLHAHFRAIPHVQFMPISCSKWNLTSAGVSSATLEITDTIAGQTVSSDFIWAHIHKPVNSFADLAIVVDALPSLSIHVKSQAKRFLDDIRDKHERQKNASLELSPGAIFRSSQASRSSTSLHFAACETLQAIKLPAQLPQAPSGHPSRLLLDVLNPGGDLIREKKQVLSQSASGNDAKCVSIMQTWLLIVSDVCLITSSARSADDLLPKRHQQKAIAHITLPPPSTSHVVKAARISLSYAGRFWTVASSECSSWPALWAIFLEAFAERAHGLAIMHGSKMLDARTWKILQKQERSGAIELRIVKDETQRTVKTMNALRSDTFGLANGHTSVRTKSTAPTETDDPEPPSTTTGVASLNIFGAVGSRNSDTSTTSFQKIADELHNVLSRGTVAVARDAYRDCEEEHQKGIDKILEQYKPSRKRRGVSFERIEFVVNLKHLFTFFWSQDNDHIVLSKFRRTIRTILESSQTQDEVYSYDWRSINDLLQRALATAVWITATFSEDLECFPMPSSDFIKAWLHLHTAVNLLALPSQPYDDQVSVHEAAVQHLKLFAICLEHADEGLVKQLRTVDIEENECVQANGIFWLALDSLMKEESGAGSGIFDTYRQCLAQLDTDITRNPTDRSLHERLRMFREEAEGLRNILDRNFASIAKARETPGMGVVGASQARPALGGDDPRLKLSRETLLQLSRKRDRFNELAELAAVLQSRTEREVGEVKNDQEKAIYLFTIVTVIFLPLSFVSSLFGMNTSDIRNLDSSQWLFWIVAIPVTVFVIWACLWFAGSRSLGAGWSSAYNRWRLREEDYRISPPSYQDAVRDHAYLAEKEQRQPDRGIDALDAYASGDRYRSSPMPLRHTPRSGLDHHSNIGDSYDARSVAPRPMARRRTVYDY